MNIKFSILFADIKDFSEQNKIGESINGETIQVIQNDTQDYYAMKHLSIIDDTNMAQELFSIYDFLSKTKYPCFLPPSYISIQNKKNDFNAIFTKYMTNNSLQYIIYQQMSGTNIYKYDDTQEFLILYGISCFLECFHSSKKVHGSIKLTNILLDEIFFPYVSDTCLYEICPKQNSKTTTKTLEYIISLSPETLRDQFPTKESDIYSFGILILQVLKHKINIFSNNSEKVDEIEQLIQMNTKPRTDGIPPKISKILDSCFSENPKNRPSATEIKKVFIEILSDSKYEKRLKEFESRFIQKDEPIDPEIEKIKKDAENGIHDSMFAYGKYLVLNQNKKIGMDYLRMASKNGYVPATYFYNNIRKDSSQNFQSSKETDSNIQVDKNPLVHLKDEKCFDQKDFNIVDIKENVRKNINKNEIYKFNEEKLLNRSFILTKDAIERLTKLKKYIDAGVPVILEGPTGTSKTLSTEIICELTGRDLIRFNLSSETKSTDLIGRYVGDSEAWAEIVMLPGPFVIAFKEGKTLLLDEINLASSKCLQFIEETLDSKDISIEIQGIPLYEIKMHPDFRLIATQNPTKTFSFINVRN